MLQGDQDDIVSPAVVKAWTDKLKGRAVLRLFPGAGHFFHGRLNDLRSTLHEVLGPEVSVAR